MKEITIKELLKLKKNKVQIIDVREKYEYDNGHLDSIHIPMEDILNCQNKICREKTVVIYCQSGRRAAAVIYMLKKEFNFNNLYNLSGGYSAYNNLHNQKNIN